MNTNLNQCPTGSVNNSAPQGHLGSIDTYCAKQLDLPASYPAAPWQPQPLNMLCSSTSQCHLADPVEGHTLKAPGRIPLSPPPMEAEAQGRCRRQVGAALVPHPATPPPLSFLPVWQEARPHLQGSVEKQGTFRYGVFVWRVNRFPGAAYGSSSQQSCRGLWINYKTQINKHVLLHLHWPTLQYFTAM